MASAAALRMAAVCMLAMCIGSQMIAGVHSWRPEQDAAAVGALLQELADEPGLDGDEVGAVVCTSACQVCLIVCSIKCVLDPNPLKCYADCIVKDACLTKTMAE